MANTRNFNRRRFLSRSIASISAFAGGVLFTEWYERLSPYGLGEEFRKEYRAWLNKLSDAQAKLDQSQTELSDAKDKLGQTQRLFAETKDELGQKETALINAQNERASTQSRLNQNTLLIKNLGKLESDSSSALSRYENDAMLAIAGLQGVIAKYASILENKWLEVESKAVNVLQTDQLIQSRLKAQVAERDQSISKLQSNLSSLRAKFEATEPQKVDSKIRVAAYYLGNWGLVKGQRSSDWSLGSPFKPLLGFYRSDDSVVADWHIKWALEHGVDTFVKLYGKRTWPDSIAFEKGFMSSRFFDKINVAIMFGTWPWLPGNAFGLSIEDMYATAEDVTKYFANTLFNRQNYLRFNNRPAFFIGYYSNFSQAAGVDKGLEFVKIIRRTAEANGFDPFIVADMMTTNHDSALNNALIENVDAITNYNILDAGKSWEYQNGKGVLVYPYEQYVEGMLRETRFWSEFAKSKGKSIMPQVLPGESTRLLFEKLYDFLVEYTGSTPDKYSKLCEGMKEFVDPNLNMVIVEAWDEFQEGSVLEPNMESGLSYINVIRDAFAVRPQSGWPEAVVPGQIY